MVLVGCVDVALGVEAVGAVVGAAVWTGGRPIAPGCGPDLEAPDGTEVVVGGAAVVVGGAAVIGAPEVVFGGGGAVDPAVDEGAKYCC